MGATDRHAKTSATPWPARIFGVGFLVWYLVIAVGGGFIGAGLNCEDNDCKPGFPSWLRPWTWGDYYVFPESVYVALAGLVPAAAFTYLVVTGRRRPAVAAFVVSLALLSYAFFGGVTVEGRWLGVVGLLLGIAALLTAPTRAASPVE